MGCSFIVDIVLVRELIHNAAESTAAKNGLRRRTGDDIVPKQAEITKVRWKNSSNCEVVSMLAARSSEFP